MGKIKKFEELNAWIEARKLSKLIYQVCGKTELLKEFALTNQIKSSAVSVMANLAEGFGRYGLKDSKQFYVMARGSLAETQSHLYVLKDLNIFTQIEFEKIYSQTITTNKLINGLISNTLKLMQIDNNS